VDKQGSRSSRNAESQKSNWRQAGSLSYGLTRFPFLSKVLKPGPNSARSHNTPSAQRFENRKQTKADEEQAQPQPKVRQNDPRDQQQRAPNPASQSPARIQVSLEETIHTKILA